MMSFNFKMGLRKRQNAPWIGRMIGRIMGKETRAYPGEKVVRIRVTVPDNFFEAPEAVVHIEPKDVIEVGVSRD